MGEGRGLQAQERVGIQKPRGNTMSGTISGLCMRQGPPVCDIPLHLRERSHLLNLQNEGAGLWIKTVKITNENTETFVERILQTYCSNDPLSGLCIRRSEK